MERDFLRLLEPADLEFAHGLSRLAGWNQTRRDWERFMALEPAGCFLAGVEGEPAGTATTTCHGPDLAWIGMVLVDPRFRRRGIGTALLKRAIGHLRDEREVGCIRLDATPEGRPLYEGLGFRPEWDLRRWVREPVTGRAPERRETREGSHGEFGPHLEAGNLSLDEAVFGADRSRLLQSLEEGSDDVLALPDGSFGMRREGERALYLGPITASSAGAGLQLAEALIGRAAGNRTLFWDLPDSNHAATDLAERCGFRPARILTRMWLGDRPVPGDPMRMFGIAEPGLG